MVLSYFEPYKHCCSYLEIEKSGSMLFGDKKMYFTTVRSKEKDYDIYLKSEKLIHSQQEHEKNFSQLFASERKWFLAISSLTNTVAAIQRQKKVDPCYLEIKKCSSQLLGARKKIMTSISSQKNWFTVSRCTQVHEKNVSQLFASGKKWFLAISSLTNTVAAIQRQKKVDSCYLEIKNVVHNCQEQGKRL